MCDILWPNFSENRNEHCDEKNLQIRDFFENRMDGLQIIGNNANQRNSMTGNKRLWNESSKISKPMRVIRVSKSLRMNLWFWTNVRRKNTLLKFTSFNGKKNQELNQLGRILIKNCWAIGSNQNHNDSFKWKITFMALIYSDCKNKIKAQ